MKTPPASKSRFPHTRLLSAIAGVGLLFWGWGTADSHALMLYVSDATNKIEKFTAAGVGSIFATSGLNQPAGIAFDSAGNLYPANFNLNGNTIRKFTPGGVGSVFATVTTFANSLAGLAFDNAGNLYVADVNANKIIKLNPSGVASEFASTGLNQPVGLAFDDMGNLYAANQGNATIQKFAPSGVGSVFASVGVTSPQFLAFTDDAGKPLPLVNQIPEPSIFAMLTLGVAAFFTRRPKRPHA